MVYMGTVNKQVRLCINAKEILSHLMTRCNSLLPLLAQLLYTKITKLQTSKKNIKKDLRQYCPHVDHKHLDPEIIYTNIVLALRTRNACAITNAQYWCV